MAVTDIELDVELLKKEVSDMKQIHGRLDTAITKITDVSNCINRMLAVHEEKISQQEEVQVRQATEFSNDVRELHSRITTSTKEMTELMTKQHYEAESEMRRLRMDISERVGTLEKWKYLIIGGSIVVGFINDNGLSGNARLVNVGSSCSLAACGTYNEIEEHSYLDLSLRKALNDSMSVYLILENTLDSEDLISRAPSEGARSQKPRTMKVGFSYDF